MVYSLPSITATALCSFVLWAISITPASVSSIQKLYWPVPVFFQLFIIFSALNNTNKHIQNKCSAFCLTVFRKSCQRFNPGENRRLYYIQAIRNAKYGTDIQNTLFIIYYSRLPAPPLRQAGSLFNILYLPSLKLRLNDLPAEAEATAGKEKGCPCGTALYDFALCVLLNYSAAGVCCSPAFSPLSSFLFRSANTPRSPRVVFSTLL